VEFTANRDCITNPVISATVYVSYLEETIKILSIISMNFTV
jgi:hypothetical protein